MADLPPPGNIALVAKYSRNCLPKLGNRPRQAAPIDENEESRLHDIAFAEHQPGVQTAFLKADARSHHLQ